MTTSRAFTLHALGAGLTLLIAILLGWRFLVEPVDLLAFSHSARTSFLHFAATAAIFYGFSLVLLHACPLPPRWGAAYAAASWPLFLRAFLPSQSAGMMRRVADEESYLAMQRLSQNLDYVSVLCFLLVQAVFLRYVLRGLRSAAPPPGSPAA